jgi:hypothetical protein
MYPSKVSFVKALMIAFTLSAATTSCRKDEPGEIRKIPKNQQIMDDSGARDSSFSGGQEPPIPPK